MLLVGLGGHAREIVDVLGYEKWPDFVFYEEFHSGGDRLWTQKIKTISDTEEVLQYFAHDPQFVLAVGKPNLREKFFNKFKEIGGVPVSVIADSAQLSKNNLILGQGLNIMHRAFLSANVNIGRGALINTGANIHHDVVIGEFAEISPNTVLTGFSSVGSRSSIGAGTVILPGIKVGSNSIIGAGSVVTRNIPDNVTAVGSPAKVIKTH